MDQQVINEIARLQDLESKKRKARNDSIIRKLEGKKFIDLRNFDLNLPEKPATGYTARQWLKIESRIAEIFISNGLKTIDKCRLDYYLGVLTQKYPQLFELQYHGYEHLKAGVQDRLKSERERDKKRSNMEALGRATVARRNQSNNAQEGSTEISLSLNNQNLSMSNNQNLSMSNNQNRENLEQLENLSENSTNLPLLNNLDRTSLQQPNNFIEDATDLHPLNSLTGNFSIDNQNLPMLNNENRENLEQLVNSSENSTNLSQINLPPLNNLDRTSPQQPNNFIEDDNQNSNDLIDTIRQIHTYSRQQQAVNLLLNNANIETEVLNETTNIRKTRGRPKGSKNKGTKKSKKTI